MIPCEPRQAPTRCRRCGGLTVVEDFCGGTEETPGWELTARRCVICGDIVDPVILEHQMSVHRRGRTLQSGLSASGTHERGTRG
jgi:hypothetical protein